MSNYGWLGYPPAAGVSAIKACWNLWGMGAIAPQILENQLTLSQPWGQIIPFTLFIAPTDFKTFLWPCKTSAFKIFKNIGNVPKISYTGSAREKNTLLLLVLYLCLRSVFKNKLWKMAYQKGEVIIKEQPFSYVIEVDCRSSICDFCVKAVSKTGKTLKNCSACKVVYYCDASCQKNAWISHHQRLVHVPLSRFYIDLILILS